MSSGPIVVVRIAELHVLRREGVLVAIGLGSCVGVALYDPVRHVAGLAHVFLPASQNEHANTVSSPAKYADVGVPALIAAMRDCGARPSHLVARIAGGAKLFLRGDSLGLDVGRRNVEATTAALKAQGVALAGADVGGNRGRTMRLFADTGRVLVTTLGEETREL